MISAAPVGVTSSASMSGISTGTPRSSSGRGRRGHRDQAVLGAHRAAPEPERRRVHLVYAERLQPLDGPHHVDQRVRRADLVEVDLLDGRAVDLRLGLGKAAEHLERALTHCGFEVGATRGSRAM